MVFRVLLSEEIHEDGIKILESIGEVTIAPSPNEEEIVNLIGDFDALIVRSSKLSKIMIESGKNLKVIGRHGIGTDNIDIPTANDMGIAIVNTPEANIKSVAEHVMGTILMHSKRFVEVDKAMRDGVFDRPGSLPGLVTKLGYTTQELVGKKIALVGVGKIARIVAKMCMGGFEMEVCGYDPFLSQETMLGLGIEYKSTLEDLVQDADYISVHVPLTKDTKDIIDYELMRKMKKTSFLINASRGGVVNEIDLVKALENEFISGAAIDVFVEEPPKADHPFFNNDKIIVTPHIAAISDGALKRMAIDVAQGVVDYLSGQEPKYLVNKRI